MAMMDMVLCNVW